MKPQQSQISQIQPANAVATYKTKNRVRWGNEVKDKENNNTLFNKMYLYCQ